MYFLWRRLVGDWYIPEQGLPMGAMLQSGLEKSVRCKGTANLCSVVCRERERERESEMGLLPRGVMTGSFTPSVNWCRHERPRVRSKVKGLLTGIVTWVAQ